MSKKLSEPDGKLHDDGCFTWNRGKEPADRRNHYAGWCTDFYLPTTVAALEQRLEDANGVNKRDGNWMDKLGGCRVCDGEIPEGHTAECDYYKLEQRLAAAEADQQRAVGAALEHVAGLFDRVGKRDEAAFLRSWRGTNPLAQAQARIAELELANKNLLNQINDGITQTKRIVELESDYKKLKAESTKLADDCLLLNQRYAGVMEQLEEARKDAPPLTKWAWLIARLANELTMHRRDRITPCVGDIVAETTHLLGLARVQMGREAAIGELVEVQGTGSGERYLIKSLSGTLTWWENARIVVIEKAIDRWPTSKPQPDDMFVGAAPQVPDGMVLVPEVLLRQIAKWLAESADPYDKAAYAINGLIAAAEGKE